MTEFRYMRKIRLHDTDCGGIVYHANYIVWSEEALADVVSGLALENVLLDPEENIKAGTMHLARLQKMYGDSGMTDAERFKFVLASYNAGEGRIADCRRLAEARNLDNTRWDDILKVIPSMRDEATLRETYLKFGKFNGTETVNYVENILNIYAAFCEICPA